MKIYVDGHNLAVRVASALPKLTTAEGVPTAEIYGVLRSVGSFRKRWPFAQLAMVWDGSCEARRRLFPAYKPGRGGAHATPAVRTLMRLLPLLGVEQLTAPEAEADDLIAKKVGGVPWQHGRMAPLLPDGEGVDEVVVVSTDRDLLQLTTWPHVRVLIPAASSAKGKDGTILFDGPMVLGVYGVRPSQLSDLRALAGDDSDGIPGVPGLGLRRSSAIIQRFKSLAGLYQQIEIDPLLVKKKLLTARQRTLLIEHKDNVWLYDRLLAFHPVEHVVRVEARLDLEKAAAEMEALYIDSKSMLTMFDPAQTSMF